MFILQNSGVYVNQNLFFYFLNIKITFNLKTTYVVS